jgi:hypothetical protein
VQVEGGGAAPEQHRRQPVWERVLRCCCRPRETRDEGQGIWMQTVTWGGGRGQLRLEILRGKGIWL